MNPEEYYAKCNLRDNPFRSTSSHASDPRAGIWVGYERQKRQIEKFLKRSRSDQVGNSNFLMLYGDYGTGKSHALLWAQNKILVDEEKDFDAVCYFIPTLRKDKGQLTFAGAFRDDIVDRSRLVTDLQSFRRFLNKCIADCLVANDLDDEEKAIDMLIEPVELNRLAKKINSRREDEELYSLLTPKSLSDYQAVMLFTGLVNLFVHEMQVSQQDGEDRRRFKKAAYLFIDELDDLDRASIKEARGVNDLLRHLYDNCPNCFGMIIALSAEISQLPNLFLDYVLSRIQKQIELVVLDKDDTVKFVREILNRNRLNPDGQKDFFPFEPEAIEAIVSQLTEITPRKIVKAMQQVIEEVRLTGHNPDTDGLASAEFLDEHDIIEEILH